MCQDCEELVLNGRVPWASNVFGQDVVLVLSARRSNGGPLVVAVDGRDPGVHLDRPLGLLALGATASSTVRLDGARIRPSAVISSDFVGYMQAM